MIEVPGHFEQALRDMQEHLEMESLEPSVLEKDLAQFFHDEWPAALEGIHARTALRMAAASRALSRPIQEAQALSIYAAKEAEARADEGDWVASLNVLLDGVQLTHSVIPQADVCQARLLVRLLSDLIARGFQTCAAFPSLVELGRARNLESLFKVAQVMWQPDLHAPLDAVIRLTPDLWRASSIASNGDDAKEAAIRLSTELARIRHSVHELQAVATGPLHRQADLTTELVDAWHHLAQRQVVRLARTDRSKRARGDQQDLEGQVKDRIGQVERELRALIGQKYAERYGEHWIPRLQKRHKGMYSNWMRILEKDRTAFRIYGDYNPSALDYAHLGDLIALVTGEWDLFRETFEFGYGRRNKSIFQDKMEHIIKVRNPIAHHRAVPKNELLRALVLCTDILRVMEEPR